MDTWDWNEKRNSNLAKKWDDNTNESTHTKKKNLFSYFFLEVISHHFANYSRILERILLIQRFWTIDSDALVATTLTHIL